MRWIVRVATSATLLFLLPSCWAQAPSDREALLLERILALEARIAALEKRIPAQAVELQAAPLGSAAASRTVEPPVEDSPKQERRVTAKDVALDFFLDSYYGWNVNRPVGRVNLLRANDVTANNFSINQAGAVIQRETTGRGSWGYRLDLMFGQATETLQGTAQNEPRPQVYRHLFQAYGSYVAPIGKGLQIDFGKWASSLGPEGNYTKDQINYSRSYLFNYLPFYHTGVRATYQLNDRLSLGYWLTNGANQTEDFNSHKSQLAQVNLKPAKSVTWTVHYYRGQEHRDVQPALNPGIPALPTQPGLSTTPLPGLRRGPLQIVDTYLFWNPTKRATIGVEYDHVTVGSGAGLGSQRLNAAALYFRHQITSSVYFGQRYVRLNDSTGLFSGVRQKLNDTTTTIGIRVAPGMESRIEYRRDFSNVPFFLGRAPGSLLRKQDTVTLGLIWWFGVRAQ